MGWKAMMERQVDDWGTDGEIDFFAEGDTEFVLGSAAGYPYELALGNYSVNTGPAALKAGERHIGKIEARLQKEGRL
jgi:hypothetical protein